MAAKLRTLTNCSTLSRRNAEAYATGDYRLWSTEGFRAEMAAERARLAAEVQAAAPSDRTS